MTGVNHLVRNRHVVESLEQSLRSGKHGLSVVPGLLKRLLAEESWREFTTQRNELVRHERFVDFVTSPPLKGLGSDLALIRRVIADDTEALDLLDQALQQRPGGDQSKSDVIRLATRQNGTSRDYALRKLRKDAPELHADVLAGRLSAHAAMVKAGYRPPTFTIRADSPQSVAEALRRRLPPEDLTELVRLLKDA